MCSLIQFCLARCQTSPACSSLFAAQFPEGVSPRRLAAPLTAPSGPRAFLSHFPVVVLHSTRILLQYFCLENGPCLSGVTSSLLSPCLSSLFFPDLLCSLQRIGVSEPDITLLERGVCVLLTGAGTLKSAVFSTVWVMLKVWDS